MPFYMVGQTGVPFGIIDVTELPISAAELNGESGFFYRNAANLTGEANLSGTFHGSLSGTASNAALFDNQHSSYFRNGANMTGTINATQLSGQTSDYYRNGANITGTANLNINGTVGATIPTSGAFTALSASSTVTLSNLSASGALVLDSDKNISGVAPGASGSVLTSNGVSWVSAAPNPSNAPTINGPTDVTTNIAATFTITNYDLGTTYTLTTTNGTVSRSEATITYTAANAGSAGFTINGKQVSVTALVAGQVAYTSASGTFSWTVPTGVTSICAVCVGGGGSGGGAQNETNGGGGGGGGALSYVNNIAVTPGETLTVVVGAGGQQNGAQSDGSAGGASGLVRGGTTVLQANGGARGYSAYVGGSGGAVAVGTGGAGGKGGDWSGATGGGGGGAGGYSGAGGAGGQGGSTTGKAGSGGAGGGGGASRANLWRGGSGGGVGLLGAGTSGASVSAGVGGLGGSGGASGTDESATPGLGGLYGGGGAGCHAGSNFALNLPASGGRGAVRIIWGSGRAFPSTNTGDI